MSVPPGTEPSHRRAPSRRALIAIGAAVVLIVATAVVVVTTRPADRPGNGGGTSATLSAGADSSAATLLGWGGPDRVDEFTGPLGRSWQAYDGPGHNRNGRRSPAAAAVDDGLLTITGDAQGTTAGLAWVPGRMYGRWEARVRAPVGDPTYNALLLLWPDAEDWPVGGEVDFMELTDPDRRTAQYFIHYGEDNRQEKDEVAVDATQWHNWAVEWTPTSVVAYLDGREWHRTTDLEKLPPRPMHLTIQLDWFPEGKGPATRDASMQVDWVKQYPLPQ